MERCNCIICDTTAEKTYLSKDYTILYECPNCGSFVVSHEFEDRDVDIHSKIKKSLLSGYIREQNELGNKRVLITNENVFDILKSPLIPRSVGEKINKYLLYLDRKTHYFSENIEGSISPHPAICYAENTNEFIAIHRLLVDNGYIRSRGITSDIELTFKGIEFVERLKHTVPESNTAFVAMWFSDEINTIYENAIKPAIESTEYGPYKAFRVDNHEHNNDITDEIIAGIKASRFVIADMTGYRGGVYYEAGFARGLGKPVIITCRKDWFDGEIIDGRIEKEKVHFDINHMNIIVWETAEELKNRLEARISATIV